MINLATSAPLGRARTELRRNRPLTDDEIHTVAPSIFAPQPHESRSARYGYIPTGRVLAALRREGFEPYQCGQSRVRDPSRRDYTRHQIRLRHAGQSLKAVNDEVFELVLLNSHDGSSAYHLYAGALRLVCTNGLVVGREIESVRVPHKGDVRERVIEGAFEVMEHVGAMREQVEAMRSERLAPDEQLAFARAALALRWEAGAEPIQAEQLNEARRGEDRGDDLWRTFNRAQEHLIRGGQAGRRRDGRVTHTRAVTGLDQGIGLNRALWTLAAEMRRLRAA